MAASAAHSERYRVSDFFALRTPLLPFTDYLQWTDGLSGRAAWESGASIDAALDEDRKSLRARLRELIHRPEVREALYVASPTLDRSLEHWLQAPDSERGMAAERVLVRYFHRMTHRCTPFGLFAGHSVGRFDALTHLELPPLAANKRHTRVDRGLISKLVSRLERSHALRELLTLFPNTSLYRSAGRLRYTQFEVDDNGNRHYKLVGVTESPYLLEVLERARSGATVAELADAVARFAEVDIDDGAEFVHELIDTQILVSDLDLRLTGPERMDQLLDRLERCGDTVDNARALRAAVERMEEMDRAGLGHPPQQYVQLAEELERLAVQVKHSSWQVDLHKPADRFTLGPAVAARIEECAALVQRITPAPSGDPLAAFRRQFQRRFEDRWVPLMEALDPESGIGFPIGTGSQPDDVSLLAGFVSGVNPAEGTESTWTQREVFMLRRVERMLAEGRHEWHLDESDLRVLDGKVTASTLPESCDMALRIAARSEQAVEQGDFDLLLQGCFGPPGGRMLGRFCHADEQLCEKTRSHLSAEESRRPDVVFAELVHLPQGRSGNLLVRPALREHEIVFLGSSGIDRERQIHVADLMVGVVDDRIVLYSEKLGKQVIPRLTSALSYTGTLGVSQFLGAIVEQHARNWLGWHWGAVGQERFLPRVRCGRIVLARASWRIDKEEIKSLVAASGSERFQLAQRWRAERKLPRFCLLVDGDNELLIDLDNALSIDTFCDVVKNRTELRLEENLPSADELAVEGPEGQFAHELVVPLLREQSVLPSPARVPALDRRAVVESFAPGSEWLYFKLYGGERTADSVLIDAVAPVIAELREEGAIDGWFFIRYSDPDPHLRVRLHGQPARLNAEALTRMHARLAPLLEQGRLWRVELATYERETLRYGGTDNIERTEQLFAIDSDAVLETMASCQGDEGSQLRWQLALLGADRWLHDFGLDLDARRAFVRRMRDAFVAEFKAQNKGTQGWFAERFRKERKSLEALIATGPVAAAFEERSRRSAPLIEAMHALNRQGRLAVSIENLANSVIHMFINRLLPSSQRAHELVIYEFLARLYDSQCARRQSA
ncbi:lantibiotic dehydratase [Steroidobacter flavus]|uniref:Lantibiotic dehydratase n=1 Tax=Steroidobacter flavus TaxID=1842136 RepID=A0ABV8SRC0_9GAMM